MKAPGIGNSCNEFMAPNTYKPQGPFEDQKKKLQKEKNEKIAVDHWHKRLFEKEKEKNPKAYPQLISKLIKPGPGTYSAEHSQYFRKQTDFAKVNQSSFGVDEKRKINSVNKVEHPTVFVPGPGSYGKITYDKKNQEMSSNFMSLTDRVYNG